MRPAGCIAQRWAPIPRAPHRLVTVSPSRKCDLAICRTLLHSPGFSTGSPSSITQEYLRRYDADGDGRLTLAEAQQALLDAQALVPAAPPPPAPSAAKPLTWELQVVQGWQNAAKQRVNPAKALADYMKAKLTNSGKARASLSDLVWTFGGMYVAVLALGVMNLYVKAWPVVGQWHQQGLGLLLGSFGTLCVLIFGKPEVEAVRLWNLLAGHLIATFIVLVLIHVFGPCIFSRALAMATMIAMMLFTDSVHPPGGALVLMAVDSHAIQTMDWWFMLYPSLAITMAVLLPLGIGVNWLKRNVRFDWPENGLASLLPPSSAAAAAGGMRPKAA